AGEMLDNVIHCIRTHRFRGDARPETLEGRVLFDADKLDAIGAGGIGRAFQFAGEVGATLHNPLADLESTAPYTREDTAYREYRLKLSRIRERMLTQEGRRLAGERHAFMERFFDRFLEEVRGKR
ncbi:MAG: phosphohydrolase, partial [Deltaproteobacteria bacterium]|nr:phosphohydrolase [Deltaproteobacteria bacterium]